MMEGIRGILEEVSNKLMVDLEKALLIPDDDTGDLDNMDDDLMVDESILLDEIFLDGSYFICHDECNRCVRCDVIFNYS